MSTTDGIPKFQDGKNQEPETYITKIEKLMLKLNTKFSCRITDNKFLIQVINGIHKDYENLINLFHIQLSNKKDPLTVEAVIEQLQLKHLHSMKWNKDTRAEKEMIENM